MELDARDVSMAVELASDVDLELGTERLRLGLSELPVVSVEA